MPGVKKLVIHHAKVKEIIDRLKQEGFGAILIYLSGSKEHREYTGGDEDFVYVKAWKPKKR